MSALGAERHLPAQPEGIEGAGPPRSWAEPSKTSWGFPGWAPRAGVFPGQIHPRPAARFAVHRRGGAGSGLFLPRRMTLLGVCFQGVVVETRRCCDCLSGSCCQAVSAALPGRVSGTSFRCTQDGGENKSLCLASALLGKCPELFYLQNKHLDSEMTLDANRPPHSIPKSAESRTSQGDSTQAALYSLVA